MASAGGGLIWALAGALAGRALSWWGLGSAGVGADGASEAHLAGLLGGLTARHTSGRFWNPTGPLLPGRSGQRALRKPPLGGLTEAGVTIRG